MPSKTLALRVPDDIYAAVDAKCLETGLNKSELVLSFILKCLDLPTAAAATPLEAKVLSLETQMDLVLSMSTAATLPQEDRLIALEDRVTALETKGLEIDRFKQPLVPSEPSVDMEPSVTTEPKISPVSIRDLDSTTNSTPEFPSTPQEPAVDLDIQQAIIAALKPHPTSGYYFRSEYLGQTKILDRYRQQAKQMGFSSEVTKIDGEKVRVWLNREYCKQLQTPNP